MRVRLATVLSLALLACPPPAVKPDSGTPPVAPTVSSVTPSNGPVTGGTQVTIRGGNFSAGARVEFADVAATQVVVVSRDTITARSPAVTQAMRVSVTVINTDGLSGTLPDAFSFEAAPTRTIDEAVLQNPADATDTSGNATVTVGVVAHVQAGLATKGAGQATGIRSQVGFATGLSRPPAEGDFVWTDASYIGDVDGTTAGDLARDAYAGDVTVPGPSTMIPSPVYWLSARFSGDNGQTWVLADRDGSANGVTQTQLSRLAVSRSSIDWCKLGGELVEAPPAVSLRGTAAGPTVYGQVYKLGVTSGATAGAGIKGQLGYGAAGANPATWTWADAAFNRDTGSGANDEFQAVLPNPGPGVYKYAYRFSHDNGPWAYCDADGLATGGFTEAQAGTLTVTALGVDRCLLQYPPSLESRQGRPTAPVYGRVFGVGVTDGTGQAVGLDAQVGFGPPADAPSSGTWTWASAAYNVEVTGGGEEYQAPLTGPAPGSYAFGYRFRYQAGAWTYCDRDSSDNGFSAAQAGQLTARAYDVDECVLDTLALSAQPSATTAPVRARVKALTLTESAGQGAGITAEVGHGAVGTQPSGWTTWTGAAFEQDATDFDQYRSTLTAPASAGTSEVAFRFRLGSNAWVYCDGDSSANGYQSAQAGRLVVTAAAISACRLESVSGFSVASGHPLTAAVRVLVPGVTAGAGAAPGLTVQVGVGTRAVNASTSPEWGWQSAAFAADVAATGEDEWAATFRPAYTGDRAVSGRASLNGGVSWTYCDLNGSDDGGYEVTQQYDVTVNPHTAIPFCNLQFPATLSAAAAAPDGGVDIYGRVYLGGVTPDAGAPITAELGLGLKVEDPGLAWAWRRAAFNVTVGNDNEYVYRVRGPLDAGLGYAYRFTLDGGAYCYGDLNGSSTQGFSGDDGASPNLGRTVP